MTRHLACDNCKPALLMRKNIQMSVTYDSFFIGRCTECGMNCELLLEIEDKAVSAAPFPSMLAVLS